jgi:hypothetical protein
MSSSPKVFAIGFNKTGTTSLTSILNSYGLKTTHDGGWHFWTVRNQFGKFSRFDAFTDGQQKDFRVLDEKYPGSKFILNTRPLQSWLASRWCHVENNKSSRRSKWTQNSKEDLMAWAYTRDNYHADVLEYFKDRPNDFMVFDIQTMAAADIYEGLDRVLKGVAKRFPTNKSIPRSNPTRNNLKNKAKKCVEDALNELGMTEEDKLSNEVSQYFCDEKYSIEIEKRFYMAHKTNNLFYQPYKKELRFKLDE